MPCTPIRNNARGGTGPNLMPYSTRRNSAPSRVGTGANNFCGACEGQPPTADEQTAADLAAYLNDVFPLGTTDAPRGRAWGVKLLTTGSGFGTTAGHIRRATTFPGTVGYRFITGALNAAEPSSFTMTFWLRPDTPANVESIIFGRRGGGFTDFLLFADNVADPTKLYWGAGVVVSSNSGEFSLNNWHLVRVWYDAANSRAGLQIDDNPPHEAAAGPIPWNIGSLCLFGTDSADVNRGFKGAAEQIGFWERVLTADEHAYLWNGGAGRDYPFPLGCATPSTRGALCTGRAASFDPYSDWINPLELHSVRFTDKSQFIWLWVTRIRHRPDLGDTKWEMFWKARVEVIGASRSATRTTVPHPYLVFYFTPGWQGGSYVYDTFVEVSTYFDDTGSGQHCFRGYRLNPLTREIQLVEQTNP